MRQEIEQFIQETVKTKEIPNPVVEFGAGWFTNVRELFEGLGHDFVATDIELYDKGKIDKVVDIYNATDAFPKSTIGTALVLETLEHLETPQLAIDQMQEVLKPDGLLVVTTLMCWEEHRYPKDYWRFLPDGIRHLLRNFQDVEVTTMGEAYRPSFIWATARRGA